MTRSAEKLTASEIGTYAFCPRAWVFQKRGCPPENSPALNEGTAYHHWFGLRDRMLRALRVCIVLLMLCLLFFIIRYFLK